MRLYVAVVAALTLVMGFAVAQSTGNRALGGVVLVLGTAWCAWMWWRAAGPVVTLVLVGLVVICFVVSHPLGAAIGSWPSVLLVAAVVGGTSYGATPRLAAARG